MKYFCRLLLLSLFGWGSVFAQSNLPACQGTDVGKWNSCFGTLNFANGDRYEGSLDLGKPSGLGSYFYFSNNQFKGTKYVGEFKNGNRHGQGVRYAESGAVLETGEWFNNGLIKFYSFESNRYPFNPPTQTSSQKLTENNQTTNLNINNLQDCSGRLFWHECYGTEINVGGTKFIGEFMNGRRHGKGQYIWENGDKFVGEYLDNKRNGIGIDYLANGQIKDAGTFRDGRLVSTHYVDPKRYPFNSSVLAAVSQTLILDTGKAERDRLAADLEASRKKQQELEEQLRASQVAVTQNIRPVQNMSTERRVALVLGNATYKINPLKNPVNDSTDMARSLRSVGFDVIEANNTTLAQMREATRRFADKLGNSDVGLVYYSGHGVEVKGKNYLIPVNADIKREYEVVDQAFDASQFLEMMDNIRGPNNKRVNILIVDACRNNELQKSWRSTNNGLARMDAPGCTFISFATAPGRVAADGAGRNSPYTKHLLQALKQPNLPIEQVFKVVRRNVMEETKGEQIPWENSSLVGDFYFTVQR